MNKTIVGIIMGSDSDLPVMQEAAEILDELGVAYEITIVSAHRTPKRMYAYATSAQKKGLKVIIAGAGGSAHLPGMTAALTQLPVIGVPVQTKSLSGLDSLYSIVQMPPGVPVATVAINGGKNAGLLAAKILAISNTVLAQKLEVFSRNLEKEVINKAKRLEKPKNLIPTNVLKTITISSLGKKESGKVRDYYILSNKRIITTTDRQSAFDRVLGCIPYKGAVLNMLAAFWFEKTKHIIPNHMIAMPDPNVLIAKNCELIPIEMVVRGYLTGVTTTSPWENYKKGERLIYGVPFPDGLKKNQKLLSPIITPTYHGDITGKGGHDTRLTRDEILRKKLISEQLLKEMEKRSLQLFTYGQKYCQKRGLILVDTKYEFGLHKGKLTLIDEIHTPDSSRYWIADTYKERFAIGEEPENFDKEFLRLWYAKKGYTGKGSPPKMSKDLIVQLAKRYIEVYEKITRQKFDMFDYPIEKRIEKNVNHYLNKI